MPDQPTPGPGRANEPPVLEVSGRFLRTARVRNEWFADIYDPASALAELRSAHAGRVDLLTFWIRPGVEAGELKYYREAETVAALPITTYDTWWNQQIDGKTRNLVRKGEKKGLTTRVVAFDDRLVEGISKIFNETPVRQGRSFWHYGKPVERVEVEMSDRLDSSVFIGAYLGQELVGFVKLLILREYAMMVEIISEVRHRDKATNNCLVSAAVRECARLELPMLTYSTWGTASLAAFKSSNGFTPLDRARYYLPLTTRGEAVLRLGLHRGIWHALPEGIRAVAREARSHYYTWRAGSGRRTGDSTQ